MARCPTCRYPLPEDRERLGARCPSCHDPLYEPPGRAARSVREGEGACTAHPGSESMGTCGRCGNFLCEVCRTRWRSQVLCAACVGRALESREATPEQARTHFRQAILGLGLGIGAWLLTLGAFAVVALAADSSKGFQVLLGLLILGVFLASTLMAVLGLGQAAAALRIRGNSMILATFGLILSGLYLGALIGLLSFSMMQT